MSCAVVLVLCCTKGLICVTITQFVEQQQQHFIRTGKGKKKYYISLLVRMLGAINFFFFSSGA